ncbi:MAG: hypothetical protein ACOCRK_11945 [bacterium]
MQNKIIKNLIYLLLILNIFLLYSCNGEVNPDVSVNEEGEKTKYGLNITELRDYAWYYKLYCNKIKEDQSLDELNFSNDMEFYESEWTGILITVFNYEIWGDYLNKHEDVLKENPSDPEYYKNIIKQIKEARIVCKDYGLSNTKRLTLDWILSEPKQAYNLMRELPEELRRDITNHYEYTYDLFDLREEDPTIEKEEIIKYGLTLRELRDYAYYYSLNSNQKELLNDLKYDENKELKFFEKKLYGGLYPTKEIIELYNYIIWDHPVEKYKITAIEEDPKYSQYETEKEKKEGIKSIEKSRKICAKYGLDSENRITIEWVLDNPYDAYHMIKQIPSISRYREFECSFYLKYIKGEYDGIKYRGISFE